MVSATTQMRELGERLKQLDLRNKQCIDRETDATKQSTLWKERYHQVKEELEKTKGKHYGTVNSIKSSECSQNVTNLDNSTIFSSKKFYKHNKEYIKY